MHHTALIAAAVLCLSFGAGHAQDVSEGQGTFNRVCRQCHVVQKDQNRLGPSLYGVVGRKAGSLPSYNNYSEGLKNSGITWDEASLDKWIENPSAVVAGNNMMPPYPGMPDAKERAGVIAYLKSVVK